MEHAIVAFALSFYTFFVVISFENKDPLISEPKFIICWKCEMKAGVRPVITTDV